MPHPNLPVMGGNFLFLCTMLSVLFALLCSVGAVLCAQKWNCFIYGKIVPLSGGRAACGGGGKVQPMRAVGAGAWKYFLDRRTEVHKVASK